MAKTNLARVLREHEGRILSEWLREQTADGVLRRDLIGEGQLREQCQTFLQHLVRAVETGGSFDTMGEAWRNARDFLGRISRERGHAGFTPSETATFVFSLKRPIFEALRGSLKGDSEAMAEELWNATQLLDGLGLYTTEVYQRSREEIINRQQSDMLELSTPVVKLWEGILALPMIGTLDSSRTQVVMETLLQRIVDTGAEIAIIDITGVPTVDTLVAQHLMKTIAAARLMGAECIISGIRPQIAQTIVHLAVDLGTVVTKASLADAFQLALRKVGSRVVRD